MVITKADFIDWKANHVTKAFFQAAEERVEDCKELLASQAGMDSIQDSFFRGFISAYREMQDFKVEDEE